MNNENSSELSERLSSLDKLVADIPFEEVISWVFNAQVKSRKRHWWWRWPFISLKGG